MPELPRNLPHLYLRGNGRAEPYTTRLRARSRPLPQRDRGVHAEAVRFALAGALAAAQVQRAERDPDVLAGTPGFYLDFELPVGSEDAAQRLENRQKHIELVAVRPESADSPARATVFVPDAAADHFLRKVEQYRDEETPTGKPKNEALIASIQTVALAAVRSLYTDDAALFPAAAESIWWEIWLRQGHANTFDA